MSDLWKNWWKAAGVRAIKTMAQTAVATIGAAAVLAVAGAVVGLFISYNLEVPPGASIIFTLTIALIVVKLLTLRSKKSADATQNHT